MKNLKILIILACILVIPTVYAAGCTFTSDFTLTENNASCSWVIVENGAIVDADVYTFTIGGNLNITDGTFVGGTNTIKFDGLYIFDGGTMNATTGTTWADRTSIQDGEMCNNGTFNHNEGKLFVNADSVALQKVSSCSGFTNWVFYDVEVKGEEDGTETDWEVYVDFQIINSMNLSKSDANGYSSFRTNVENKIITLGNESQACQVYSCGVGGGDCSIIRGSNDKHVKVYGKSADYPANITESTVFFLDTAIGGQYRLANMSFEEAVVTGAAVNHNIFFDGGINFTSAASPSLTVSSGDTVVTTTGDYYFAQGIGITGTLTHNDGTGTITVAENEIVGDGTYNVNNATVNVLISDLEVDNTNIDINGVVTVGDLCGHDTDIFTFIGPGQLTCDRFHPASIVPGTGTVTIAGSGNDPSLNGAFQFYNLIIASSGTETFNENINVTNSLLISSGILRQANGDEILNVTGTFTSTGGTLTGGSGETWAFNNINISGGTITLPGGSIFTQILGDITYESGTFEQTNSDSTLRFIGDSDITGGINVSNIRVDNNLTINSDINYTLVNVTATGNLTYSADNTDTSVEYWKAGGGSVWINNSATLTSTTCNLNGTLITDNTTGATYWIDDIEAGSAWLTGDASVCSVSGTYTMIANENCGSGMSITGTVYTAGFGINVTGNLENNGNLIQNNSEITISGDYYGTGEWLVDPSLVNITGNLNCTNLTQYNDSEVIISGNLTGHSGCIFELINSSLQNDGYTLWESGSVFNASLSGLSVSHGSLKIDSGANYSATNQTTTITSESTAGESLNFAGTFVHNDGNVSLDYTSISGAAILVLGSAVFYDLDMPATAASYNSIKGPFTVINTLNTNDILYFDQYSYDINLTLGNNSQSGTIGGTGSLSFNEIDRPFSSQIYAVNEFYPGIISNTGIHTFGQGGGGLMKLRWLDWQSDIVTGGNGMTFQIDGNSKFDSVTVTATDVWNMNDTRVEFDGTFYVLGGVHHKEKALIYTQKLNIDAAPSVGDGTSNIFAYQTGTNAFDLIPSGTSSTPDFDNFFISGSAILSASIRGETCIGGTRNFIIGGTLNTNGKEIGLTCSIANITLLEDSSFIMGDDYINVDDTWNAATSGFIGAYSADVVGNRIINHSQPFSNNGYALEGWFNFDNINDENYLLEAQDTSNDGVGMFTDGSGVLWAERNADLVSYGGLASDTWYHLATTADGSVLRLYVNGELVNETASVGAVSTTVPLHAFIRTYDLGFPFEGICARYSAWNESLNTDQIRELMFDNYGDLDNTSSLAVWVQFDEGSGSNVGDSHTTANNGTIINPSLNPDATLFWNLELDAVVNTEGTSTVTITGSDNTILFTDGEDFYNLEVAPSGGTTTISAPAGNSKSIDIFGNLTLSGGTFTDSTEAQRVRFFGIDTNHTITAPSTLADVSQVHYRAANTQYIAGTNYTFMLVTATGTVGYQDGDIVVSNQLELGSASSYYTQGNDITIKQIEPKGRFNITAPSVITFTDDSTSGFIAGGDGYLNIIGTSSENNVTIRCASSPGSCSNPWKVNQSVYTEYLWKYVAIEGGDSIGPENMVVLGWNTSVDTQGFWDFNSPVITATYPLQSGTTAHNTVSETNFTVNITGEDETNLDAINWTVYDSTFTKVESQELDTRSNESFTWDTSTFNTTGLSDGTYYMNITVWDTHNYLSEKDKYKIEGLELVFEDGKYNKKDKLKTKFYSDTMYYFFENESRIMVKTISDYKAEIDLKDKDEDYKLDYIIKTDDDAQITFEIYNVTHVTNSHWGNAHFMSLDKLFYYDFYTAETLQGITTTVSSIGDDAYRIILTHPDWKAKEKQTIDPSAGAINSDMIQVQFELTSSAPDITNVDPFNGRLLTPSTDSWTYTVTTGSSGTCYWSTSSMSEITDGTIMQSTGGTSHTNLMTGFSPGNQYCYYFMCNSSIGSGALSGPYCVQIQSGAPSEGGGPTSIFIEEPLIITPIVEDIGDAVIDATEQMAATITEAVSYVMDNKFYFLGIFVTLFIFGVLMNERRKGK